MQVPLELAHMHTKKRLEESCVFLPFIEAVVYDESSEASGDG